MITASLLLGRLSRPMLVGIINDNRLSSVFLPLRLKLAVVVTLPCEMVQKG